MDVDLTACHMAYIQLSLLGCNAVVVHGNTLSLEEFNFFETPLRRLFPIHDIHIHEITPTNTPLSTQTQLNHCFGTCTQINSKSA